MIISPRQAGDKHRESTQKKRTVFLQAGEGDWGRGASLTRSFFYCHHIRTKQARVYEWSAELRLSGRVKIGAENGIFF
jgi:hypothetical protein